MKIRLLSCLAMLLVATSASAATFHVDDTGDAVDATPGDGVCATDGGACTLRAAVQEANALAGPDRIRVPAGTYVLAIGGKLEDDAATGDLDVHGTLRVIGAGEGDTVVDGNDLDRVFDLQDGARATFAKLAVRGGTASGEGYGGGIRAGDGSHLTLKRVVVEANEASSGGGIAGGSHFRMSGSTVRGNVASLGGGLVVSNASIRTSTFDGNWAAGIGPLAGDDIATGGPGTVAIVNSTITGQIQNFALCDRPFLGTCTEGADVLLANVTVNAVSSVVLGRDSATVYPGSFTLRNTIVEQCGADLISQGYNFVRPEGCTILGDLTGVVVGDDPLLGSLKDNGGPTFTRLPVAVSAAVDGGNPATPGSGGFACEPFDQRGVPRFLGLGCDIGAVEGH